MTRTGEEAQSEIEVDVDCRRAVDNPAVAEWVVAQVTVRIGPVELRCWRELGGGVTASSGIVGWTRTLGSRTVGDIAVWLAILLRTGLWTVVVRLVVRTVIDIAVVWTVVVRAIGYVAVVWTVVVRTVVDIAVVRLVVLVAGINPALGADIAHMIFVIPSSVCPGVVSSAHIRIAVGRSLPVGRRVAVLWSRSFAVLILNRRSIPLTRSGGWSNHFVSGRSFLCSGTGSVLPRRRLCHCLKRSRNR